jgi:hypothetical protein
MSSSLLLLVWEGDKENDVGMSFATKVRLSPVYFGHDGSCGGPGDTFTEKELPRLRELLGIPAPAECQHDLALIEREIAEHNYAAMHFVV